MRTAALELPGCNGSDEDVLTCAMFPQVAPKFFSTRDQGPKNLGKDPNEQPAARRRTSVPGYRQGPGPHNDQLRCETERKYAQGNSCTSVGHTRESLNNVQSDNAAKN